MDGSTVLRNVGTFLADYASFFLFHVLLTAQLNIILVINQLNAQILGVNLRAQILVL